MEIIMIKNLVGYPAGMKLEVSDIRGERWIEEGIAKPAVAKARQKKAPPASTPTPAKEDEE